MGAVSELKDAQGTETFMILHPLRKLIEEGLEVRHVRYCCLNAFLTDVKSRVEKVQTEQTLRFRKAMPRFLSVIGRTFFHRCPHALNLNGHPDTQSSVNSHFHRLGVPGITGRVALLSFSLPVFRRENSPSSRCLGKRLRARPRSSASKSARSHITQTKRRNGIQHMRSSPRGR